MHAIVKTLLCLTALAATATALQPLEDNQYELLFTQWAVQYNKAYEASDMFHRFRLFKSNLDYIREHNAKNATYTLGMNAFGDLTADEFFGARLGLNHVDRPYLRSLNIAEQDVEVAVPAEVDWVKKGAVTPVKDQGSCGSCWAFSATGAMEGAWKIAKGKLISLSEQELVDCASSYGNKGCRGGLMDAAFEFVIDNGGIETEEQYPYTASEGKCEIKSETGDAPRGTVHMRSYKDVKPGDEEALKAAVAKGPVSVAIEADRMAFQFYSGGILDNPGCGTQLDHGVLLVGYGTENGKDFWKIKNSWGNSWGEAGYIRMSRGNNMCGVSQSASFPAVA